MFGTFIRDKSARLGLPAGGRKQSEELGDFCWQFTKLCRYYVNSFPKYLVMNESYSRPERSALPG